MGISGTDTALMYAQAGIARAGATRAGYYGPKVCISVGGLERGYGRASAAFMVEDLVITDTLNELPNRASFLARGWVPVAGMAVRIRLGSVNNSHLSFAGTVLAVDHAYVGPSVTHDYHVSCVDRTWGLNRRKVIGYYTGSASTIAVSLIATYATGYTSTFVQAGLETVQGGITFTNENLTDCLSRLAARIGAYWYCDYDAAIHFFTTDPEMRPDPRALTSAHPTLRDEGFQLVSDLSQIVTRVVVEGGGGSALTVVMPGESILPIDEALWYDASGGGVVSNAQRITYTGVAMGGGGGLVGPGASASVAPVLALASGTGIDTGAHTYAVTFLTGAGESVSGPTAAITTGVLAAAGVGPTTTLVTGAGIEDGAHDYAITYVTATGETTPCPSTTITVGGVADAAPTSACTAGASTAGVGVTAGLHQYAVSFVTPRGETARGPAVSRSAESVSGGVTYNNAFPAGPIPAGYYSWGIAFVGPGGESDVLGTATTIGSNYTHTFTIPAGPDGTTARRYYRSRIGGGTRYLAQTISGNTPNQAVTDSTLDGDLGTAEVVTSTFILGRIALSNIPIGPYESQVTARKIYRTEAGGATYKLLTTLADNTTTTYADALADGSLGAPAPTGTTLNTVHVTDIPIGPSIVTARKIYRTAAGGTQLKLLTTLADNTTTTYADSTADASLTTNAPATNTATAGRVALSTIPIGPSGTTSRKLYRTVAGGSQLKLLATIADNTTTTYADVTADASLTTNVPTSDTSGLAQPSGQVIAGSTTLPVAGLSGFPSAGWAVIGNGAQVIRYTGQSSTALTGIPASGAGAITASIGYNSTVTAAPQLTGIPATGTGSILYAIKKGDLVNLFVQRNATTAQATLAALLNDGSDGVVEEYVQDGRLSEAEAVARGDAYLELHSPPAVTLNYRCRDLHTRSGQTVVANITSPTPVAGTFRIQEVRLSEFSPLIYPVHDVTASTTRFSFEDLLRLVRQGAR